ncbi:MAG: cytochrome-c oxidase, cbb3-type subunit I [Deltaproteobacteria bacterium]|jgi:cytochrome c oxidase cbb3-type subunit I/II|nr:cytochrome-c oxidase, cbb3-type subunit I [Deltaproteobacteria bacterium]MBT4267303.1 cytochrome-c oxidase, cbb3-type subunit I [Deltaproteobacteria bacterium]MBT4638196.1 cytochrome-c oxidase, cbb3-type subunit I [Deltaproteobacteria bacterium]MBT6501392.1 cytochrome-c oxidase, cbb3-type subunit I [Deltaproteobacteria bacterium]MBT6614380.1 cytochrome-c oxidase, cbb3-type subunit I [Deltaproteobacteria bacterium]
MSNMESFHYDDAIVRKFTLVTILWGVVALSAGVLIASQLAFWQLNLGPWFSFGRLRPIHTNVAIFAFVGNSIFAGIYYSTQRLCKARLFNDLLSNIHFWGWQLIIICAALTLPFGLTTGKEYAELEWSIDIMIAIVWVIFAINFFGTLIKRREKHIYVAIWFYIATILTVAILHIVNSISIPVSFLKSYPIYAGVQDALVQWWYGHNAVAFFLTTPVLGLMYYFLPKAANRPVYSYRLSVVHFWSLVFIYIWAGPHHLLFTALPDWAQSLGMVFSLMLIAPSWGGMLNGLLTLRGAWDKLRTDPILKFLVVAVSFYGMSTFEGPMLAIKSVNALSHYTDWTIGHVHSGTLGWNGFMIFAMLYYLVPRLWKNDLYSVKLATAHFWLATIGIVFYIVSMWVAGITQGLMWRAFNPDGYLTYGSFVETVTRIIPMYYVRLMGGTMYLTGILLLLYNVAKTIVGVKAPEDEKGTAPAIIKTPHAEGSFLNRLESNPIRFALFTLIAVSIGGLVEIVPTFVIRSNIPTISAVKPYTPLELEGRDLYLREGCYVCHSQMIRPFRAETERYGDYSKPGEFVYDYPFQWGSRRIGPDLHRIGKKYPDMWHYLHMKDPRLTSPGSIMPGYDWLYENYLDTSNTKAKMKVMKVLGVPYTNREINYAVMLLQDQAGEIDKRLGKNDNVNTARKEIVALIAYLQRLGTDIKSKK